MGSFIALSLPGRFYAHYYQLWLPYLSLATALGTLEIQSRVANRFHGKLRVVQWAVAPAMSLFALSFLFISLFVWHPWIGHGPDWISHKKYGSLFADCREIGLEIKEKTKPDQKIYQWGSDPGVYLYARRDPIVGVPFAYMLLSGPLHEEFTQRTLTQLKEMPPDYVVVDVNQFQRPEQNAVSEWIRDHYVPDPKYAIYGQFRMYVRHAIDGKVE